MARTVLHDDVTAFEMNSLGVIKLQPNFTRDNDQIFAPREGLGWSGLSGRLRDRSSRRKVHALGNGRLDVERSVLWPAVHTVTSHSVPCRILSITVASFFNN